MNFVIKFIAAVLLSGVVSQAMAVGESIEIKVKGRVVPPSCKPSVTGGTTLDYGDIDASSLKNDDFTKLPEDLNTPFSLVCNGATKVALRAIDLRKNTVVLPVGVKLHDNEVTEGDKTILGLGESNGKKIGGYKAVLHKVKADGQDATSLVSYDEGETWKKPNSSSKYFYLEPDTLSTVGNENKMPLAVKSLNGILGISAALNKGSELDLKKEINLDGLFTIEIVYL